MKIINKERKGSTQNKGGLSKNYKFLLLPRSGVTFHFLFNWKIGIIWKIFQGKLTWLIKQTKTFQFCKKDWLNLYIFSNLWLINSEFLYLAIVAEQSRASFRFEIVWSGRSWVPIPARDAQIRLKSYCLLQHVVINTQGCPFVADPNWTSINPGRMEDKG